MRCDLPALVAVCAGIALAAPSASQDSEPHVLRARNIVDAIADSYDFVIIGGGLAGLVLGGRLSEDSNHTVLVLESGGNGDEFRERIDTPALAYFDSLWSTPANWQFETTPQAGAHNREVPWPRGKVLGGSAAMNGQYLNRPAELDINVWRGMLGDMDGADNWTWGSLFAAMKKSETFTPPVDGVMQEAAITWDPASHGTDGPIHMTYPGYTFPEVGYWSASLDALGVGIGSDTYSGLNPGAYVCASTINPANWTRSYSRTGYLDPLPNRPNYAVLPNAHVTRILFDSSDADNITANAVEYTRDGGATRLTVGVNKEVIVAGGAIGSPAVLLYSGIGPRDVLDAAGVPVVTELPGVGQHLQDHLSATLHFSSNQPTAGSIYDDGGPESTDPAFLSFVNSAIAYVNGQYMYGSGLSAFQQSILGQMDQYTHQSITDPGVLAGYQAIYQATANTILPSPLGQVELLLMNTAFDGAIGISAAIQHPYSHGRVYITSANGVDYPLIDPNYLAHPADLQSMREGLKLARRLGETPPLSNSITAEVSPGPDVQTDDEWDDWLRDQVGTEFHPSSTCAMLPRDMGGVVDANLRVYGLSNVRVADASVPPITFTSHLMGSTYGLAEQASTIIRAYHNFVPALRSNTTLDSDTSRVDSDTDATSGTDSNADANSNSNDDTATSETNDSQDNGSTLSSRPSVLFSLFAVGIAFAILL